MILEKQIYAVGFPNLMQACLANSLIVSRMLQIPLNLQQKQQGDNNYEYNQNKYRRRSHYRATPLP